MNIYELIIDTIEYGNFFDYIFLNILTFYKFMYFVSVNSQAKHLAFDFFHEKQLPDATESYRIWTLKK